MAQNHKPSPVEIEKHLKGISFPANKQDLIRHAREHNAPDGVVSVLDHMPERQYRNAADVAKGVGEVG